MELLDTVNFLLSNLLTFGVTRPDSLASSKVNQLKLENLSIQMYTVYICINVL